MHGPYSSSMMLSWHAKHYFQGSLEVKGANMNVEWSSLEDILPLMAASMQQTRGPQPAGPSRQDPRDFSGNHGSFAAAGRSTGQPGAKMEGSADRDVREPPRRGRGRGRGGRGARHRENEAQQGPDSHTRSPQGGGRGGRGGGRGGRGGNDQQQGGRGHKKLFKPVPVARRLFTCNAGLATEQPLWRYLDQNDQVQGPFTSAEMLKWYISNALGGPDLRLIGHDRVVSPPDLPPLSLYRRLGDLLEEVDSGKQYSPATAGDIEAALKEQKMNGPTTQIVSTVPAGGAVAVASVQQVPSKQPATAAGMASAGAAAGARADETAAPKEPAAADAAAATTAVAGAIAATGAVEATAPKEPTAAGRPAVPEAEAEAAAAMPSEEVPDEASTKTSAPVESTTSGDGQTGAAKQPVVSIGVSVEEATPTTLAKEDCNNEDEAAQVPQSMAPRTESAASISVPAHTAQEASAVADEAATKESSPPQVASKEWSGTAASVEKQEGRVVSPSAAAEAVPAASRETRETEGETAADSSKALDAAEAGNQTTSSIDSKEQLPPISKRDESSTASHSAVVASGPDAADECRPDNLNPTSPTDSEPGTRS